MSEHMEVAAYIITTLVYTCSGAYGFIAGWSDDFGGICILEVSALHLIIITYIILKFTLISNSYIWRYLGRKYDKLLLASPLEF